LSWVKAWLVLRNLDFGGSLRFLSCGRCLFFKTTPQKGLLFWSKLSHFVERMAVEFL